MKASIDFRYKVVAYDTDYGFVNEWYFQSIENASKLVQELEYDYGSGCAHIVDLNVKEGRI